MEKEIKIYFIFFIIYIIISYNIVFGGPK